MSETDFFTYYRSVGKTPKGETLPAGREYLFDIRKCDENESIDVPNGALITAAYWGNPKKYSQGKDVTAKVIMYARKRDLKRFLQTRSGSVILGLESERLCRFGLHLRSICFFRENQ